MMHSFIVLCSIAGAFEFSSASSSSDAVPSAKSGSSQWLPGPCPQIEVDPIDYEMYAGTWYEVQRSSNDYHEGVDACHVTLWGKPVNNMSEVVHKSYLHANSKTAVTVSKVVKDDEKAASFSHPSPNGGEVTSDFYVLDTDYDEHSIVWTCEPQGNNHIEKSWVFAREPEQPCNIENEKLHAFSRYKLPVPHMIYHDLSDCDPIYASYFAEI